MKPRTQPKRISDKKLKALGNKMPWSSIQSKPKPLKKRNEKRIAKRKAGYRKMLRSKEYLAAKTEAFERAGGQCEETKVPTLHWTPELGLHEALMRCQQTERLQAHHLRYPKSRPIAASDLKILCFGHHAEVEAQKLHKAGRPF